MGNEYMVRVVHPDTDETEMVARTAYYNEQKANLLLGFLREKCVCRVS